MVPFRWVADVGLLSLLSPDQHKNKLEDRLIKPKDSLRLRSHTGLAWTVIMDRLYHTFYFK